jgi:hypothetical protein
MTIIMSELHAFEADPDEMSSFGFVGDFDFDRDFIPEDDEYAPASVPSRVAGSSPNGSDGSGVDQSISPDNSNQMNFPVLLHEIVSNEEFDHCVHWLPCGTLFVISDKDAFTKFVIPRFFDARGTTKFTSFTRRLKRWSFSRVASGTNHGAYYHEKFRRGQPEMAATINYPAKVPKKNSPTAVVKSKVKARRRASTGCMVEPEKSSDIGFTPIPVSKPSVKLCGNPALLELDSDMTELLSSPDFIKEEKPLASTSMGAMPATPPFSASKLQPLLVTDYSSKHTLSTNDMIPTSVQSEKLHLSSTYQPNMQGRNQPIQSQSILQNPALNMMHQMQQPLSFPGMMNFNQQPTQFQMQRQVSQPQMRRHSCMPMFGESNHMDAASLFGSSAGTMGAFDQSIPIASASTAFNPTLLQVNNMRMNQNIYQNFIMMNTKTPEFPGQKADTFVPPTSREVTSRDLDQEDKWVDFDEYVARQDDE